MHLNDDVFEESGGGEDDTDADAEADGEGGGEQEDGKTMRSRLTADASRPVAIRAGKSLVTGSAATATGAGGKLKYPKAYDLVVKMANGQQTTIFSENPTTDQRALEGVVVRRCDLKPQMNEGYRSLNRARLIQSESGNRTVQVSGVKKVNYKPTDHSLGKKTREDPSRDKRERMPREQLDDVIFKAFEKHQFYTLRGLVEITQQVRTFMAPPFLEGPGRVLI